MREKTVLEEEEMRLKEVERRKMVHDCQERDNPTLKKGGEKRERPN